MTHEPISELKLRATVIQDGVAIGALFLASRRDALPYLPKLHSEEETLRWIVGTLIPTRIA